MLSRVLFYGSIMICLSILFNCGLTFEFFPFGGDYKQCQEHYKHWLYLCLPFQCVNVWLWNGGSDGRCMFTILRSLRTVVQSDCATSHSYWWYRRVLVAPHLAHIWFDQSFVCLFRFNVVNIVYYWFQQQNVAIHQLHVIPVAHCITCHL